ncbi:MAG: heavy metal resistance protein [Novosphingobium sp.]|uniref:periplasmic heavy metal sensor n=1 Tax=Novosphingobium naphthalenivorans TaxID=273168 RepID=UPI00082A511A|nr:periplasmic heavy metal sensor [Novosphingobium naphthalenivorans]MAC59293.1 heavy metal resistance protein [Novosphingobium sp.]
MKITPVYILLLLLLAVAAGALGTYGANRWIAAQAQPHGIHEFVHKELRLTASQETQLEGLEQNFAVQHSQLELALRAANANLARAMNEEHRYGPKVGAAIDQVHARMGDLQKATVQHVFNMRALLDPQQQKAFDREVSEALTSDPKN